MPESIESFVKKLQSEGVDAGNEAAEKIKEEAKLEAEAIVADAKDEAKKILEKAESDAEKKLSRAQTELELAVRDSMLKLRESLGHVLSVLLARRVEKKLSEPEYIGEIVRELVTAYAKADTEQQARIEINIPEKMRAKLDDSVLNDLFQNLGGKQDKPALRATLTKAGFEYKIHGATVEVSPDSVSELLLEMVSPALQEIIERAIGDRDRESPEKAPTERKDKKPATGRKKPEKREVTAKEKK